MSGSIFCLVMTLTIQNMVNATFKNHYMDIPKDIIWERLCARNKLAGKNAIFYVGKEEFDEWAGLFEIPAKEELEQ